jgi:cell division protein FtsB
LSKFSNIFKGEHKNFRIFVAFSTAVFVFIWLVGPGNTWIHWAKAGVEIKRQERQIREYEQEIERMDKRVDMLKTDRDTLEKFAREQFHFAAPGDDVYVIE